ncbi:MAG: hypothetical protein AAF211_12765 [Myxococcota bacterium]
MAGSSSEPPDDADLDYWPILRQPVEDLVDAIDEGDHDRHLRQLERMEAGHDRRRSVLEACRLRRHELERPSDDDPIDDDDDDGGRTNAGDGEE